MKKSSFIATAAFPTYNTQMIRALIFLIALILTTPTHAQNPPVFTFPLDCTLGQDCFTATYMDLDPADNSAKDNQCGRKTYDGHKGTDFAVRSRIEMNNGVNVLAARNGKVLRVRDGEDDAQKTEAQYAAIQNSTKECGNGILITHQPGVQSFYCHLKQGSITVKPGDTVTAGQPIAQLGQSGFSEYPHLHFTIIWEGTHIDPFTGASPQEGCATTKQTLWAQPIPYEPFTLHDGGFTTAVPNFKHIKTGQYQHPASLTVAGNDAIVYWIGHYHAVKDDQITMTLRNPSGQTITQRTITIEDNKKRPSYYYTGKKLRGKALTPGTYTATTHFQRNKKGDQPAAQKTYTHTIEVTE